MFYTAYCMFLLFLISYGKESIQVLKKEALIKDSKYEYMNTVLEWYSLAHQIQ